MLYKKKVMNGGRILYAFKNMHKAHGEENGFLEKASTGGDSFSLKAFDNTLSKSGVIVFESNFDTDSVSIYQCYEQRWLLELLFRRYKSDEGLDKTSAQGDFTVKGSELVNFIATLITSRLLNRIEKTNLLKRMSYGDLMDDLTEACRRVDAPDVATSDDGGWMNVPDGVLPELEALGLSSPVKNAEKIRPDSPRTKPLPEPKPQRRRGAG